jgi:hypothetical protein
MPPDGDHLNHRAKMYQRSPPEKGRLNVASSSGERATRDDEGKDRENPPTKVSRRVRDLLIAIFAALSVSYLVTCFRPSPDLFGASPMVLEQQQHGVPSAESYQGASTSSDNVLQVVNTRYVCCLVMSFPNHRFALQHELLKQTSHRSTRELTKEQIARFILCIY